MKKTILFVIFVLGFLKLNAQCSPDNTAPAIVNFNNLTKNLSASGNASISISDVENGSTDNCTSTSSLLKELTWGTQTKVSTLNFNCSNVGTQNITYTVTDASGNSSSTTVKVTISDVISPTIKFNNNLTKYLNASGNTSISITDVENGSTDNCTANGSLTKELTYGTQAKVSTINFTCTDIGTKSITYVVTDANGNSSSTSVTVTIADNTNPTVNINNNLTKYLTSGGTASISITDIENGSTDNCTSQALLDKKMSYGSQTNVSTVNLTCSDIGNQNITYNVKDANGNTGTSTVKVTIIDNINPTIGYNNNLTKYLNSTGTASISITDIENGSTDNCTLNASLIKKLSYGSQSNVSTVNFICSDIGSQNITYSVTDASGNISSVIVKVTITDNLAPNISFNNNLTKYLNSSGLSAVSIPDVENGSSDNCTVSGNLLKKLSYSTQSNVSTVNLSCADIGNKTITYSVTDANGNVSTTNVKVNVLDTISSQISCNSVFTKYLTSTGISSISIAEIEVNSTDNCTSNSNLTKTLIFKSQNGNNIYFNCGNRGYNTIQYKVTDASGNYKVKAITVRLLDTISPKLVLKTPVVHFSNSGNNYVISKAQLDSASIDNCNIDFSFIPSYLTANNIGSNLIFVKGIDSSGNLTSTFTSIDLRDTTRPKITFRKNINLYLNNSGYAQLSTDVKNGIGQDSSLIISLFDNCDKSPQITLSKTNFFSNDLSTSPQTVKLTVTDKSGNSTICFISVMIKDTIAPILLLKNNPKFYLASNGIIKINPNDLDSNSSDNSNFLIIELDRNKFTCNDAGYQTIRVKAIDKSGNITITNLQIYIAHLNLYGTIYSKINVTKTVKCKDLNTGEISLESMGGSEPINYTWKKNNQVISTNNPKQLNGLSAGFYSVIIKDINNCYKTDSVQITEPSVYLPIISKSKDTSICLGTTVKIQVKGGVNYVWNNENLMNFNTIPNPTVYPTRNTIFKVKVTDENGCENSDSIKININNLPNVKIQTSNNEFCIGNQINLTAQGGVNYIWYPAQAFVNNKLSIVKTNISVTQFVYLMGIDNNGCKNWDSMNIIVNPLPNLTITNPDSICLGQSKQLIASGANTYSWTGANLDFSNINNPLATPTKTTKYVVTGTSLKGCKSADSTIVYLSSRPTATSIYGLDRICQNTNWVEYTCPSNDAVKRDWSVTNGTVNYSNNNAIYIHWKNGSTGSILLKETKIQYPYCSITSNKVITLNKSIATQNNFIYVKGNDINSNILISKIQNSPYTIWGYESKVDFKEINTCNNSNWCKYTHLDTFRNRYWVKIGDSLNCLQKTYLNEPSYLNNMDLKKNIFQIFPNPTSNYIEITNQENIELVCVYSSVGELLLKTSQNKIELNYFSSGNYIVEITDKHALKSIRKITVVH